jgi:hypothetical protein
MYDTAKISGISKIGYQIFLKKEKRYDGSIMYAYPFSFFTIENAKQHIKNRNLKNVEIHKIESITLEKEPVIVK